MARFFNPKTKSFLTIFSVILICVFLSYCINRQDNVYRVGVIQVGESVLDNITEGLRYGMKELGYEEGVDIFYDIQIPSSEIGLPEIVEKFVQDDVDLIFVYPTGNALDTKHIVGESIPIVFGYAVIEGNDIVESSGRPGGNITGVRDSTVDVSSMRIEMLKNIMPNAEKIWIAYQRDYPSVEPQMEIMRSVASSSNMTIIEVAADSIEEVRDDLDKRNKLNDTRIDAIMIIPEKLIAQPQNFETVLEFSERNNIPICGLMMDKESVIFAYEVDFFQVGVKASSSVEKILNGIPAGNLPVITPEQKLLINYRAIQKFNLSVSDGILSIADTIIK